MTTAGCYRSRSFVCAAAALCATLAAVQEARADRTKAVREAVEYVLAKFGTEVGEETAETLAAKLTRLATEHGDEAIEAFRKVGPRALRVIEEAGEDAPKVAGLLSRRGPEALWIVTQPERMAVFTRFGDDAAEAMIRHKAIAEPLIAKYESAATQALKAVDGQNARRLAMLEDSGDLARIGRTRELLNVVGRYGDAGANFVWRNKGALAVGAALSAFLLDPEPFIDGTRELATVAAAPVNTVVQEAARRTNWTLIVGLVVVLSFGMLAGRRALRATRAAITRSSGNRPTG